MKLSGKLCSKTSHIFGFLYYFHILLEFWKLSFLVIKIIGNYSAPSDRSISYDKTFDRVVQKKKNGVNLFVSIYCFILLIRYRWKWLFELLKYSLMKSIRLHVYRIYVEWEFSTGTHPIEAQPRYNLTDVTARVG